MSTILVTASESTAALREQSFPFDSHVTFTVEYYLICIIATVNCLYIHHISKTHNKHQPINIIFLKIMVMLCSLLGRLSKKNSDFLYGNPLKFSGCFNKQPDNWISSSYCLLIKPLVLSWWIIPWDVTMLQTQLEKISSGISSLWWCVFIASIFFFQNNFYCCYCPDAPPAIGTIHSPAGSTINLLPRIWCKVPFCSY